MEILWQLVKAKLNLGADGLGGEEEHLFTAVGVQELVGDGPSVQRLLEVVEPVFGHATLLFVLCVVEGLRHFDYVLFYCLHFSHLFLSLYLLYIYVLSSEFFIYLVLVSFQSF